MSSSQNDLTAETAKSAGILSANSWLARRIGRGFKDRFYPEWMHSGASIKKAAKWRFTKWEGWSNTFANAASTPISFLHGTGCFFIGVAFFIGLGATISAVGGIFGLTITVPFLALVGAGLAFGAISGTANFLMPWQWSYQFIYKLLRDPRDLFRYEKLNKDESNLLLDRSTPYSFYFVKTTEKEAMKDVKVDGENCERIKYKNKIYVGIKVDGKINYYEQVNGKSFSLMKILALLLVGGVSSSVFALLFGVIAYMSIVSSLSALSGVAVLGVIAGAFPTVLILAITIAFATTLFCLFFKAYADTFASTPSMLYSLEQFILSKFTEKEIDENGHTYGYKLTVKSFFKGLLRLFPAGIGLISIIALTFAGKASLISALHYIHLNVAHIDIIAYTLVVLDIFGQIPFYMTTIESTVADILKISKDIREAMSTKFNGLHPAVVLFLKLEVLAIYGLGLAVMLLFVTGNAVVNGLMGGRHACTNADIHSIIVHTIGNAGVYAINLTLGLGSLVISFCSMFAFWRGQTESFSKTAKAMAEHVSTPTMKESEHAEEEMEAMGKSALRAATAGEGAKEDAILAEKYDGVLFQTGETYTPGRHSAAYAFFFQTGGVGDTINSAISCASESASAA